MAMINTRYGHSEEVTDPNDDWITEKLIDELRSEELDEPDDEHTQVSVGNELWAVTAHVSGLITLDNLGQLESAEFNLSEPMHLRNISDEQLIRIWQTIVRGDDDALLDNPWQQISALPPYVSDWYRD